MLRKHQITDIDIDLGYFISIYSVQSLTVGCWMMITVIKKNMLYNRKVILCIHPSA